MSKIHPGCALLLALTVVTLAACGSRPAEMVRHDEAGASADSPVVGPQWNLLLVGTDERLSMPEKPHFTVSGDGRVAGSDGCNPLTGQVSFGDKGRIEFSELATSRRACPEAEDAERVTDMLENAYRYLIDHDRLVFFGPDQRVLGGWQRAD